LYPTPQQSAAPPASMMATLQGAAKTDLFAPA
jgi:hypothetical protein